MPFNFPCPKCGKTILNVPESYAGQRGRCLNCKGLVTIPTMVVEEVSAPVISQEPLVSSPVVKTGGGSTAVRSPIPPAIRAAVVAQGVPDPVPVEMPEVIPPLVERAGGGVSLRHQKSRGVTTRRYPILRRYCSMLTVLSLIFGSLLIVTGAGLAFSVFFGFRIPALGESSAFVLVLLGLMAGLGGYAGLVAGLAGVDLARVLMDIEENTRRCVERSEGGERDEGDQRV